MASWGVWGTAKCVGSHQVAPITKQLQLLAWGLFKGKAKGASRTDWAEPVAAVEILKLGMHAATQFHRLKAWRDTKAEEPEMCSPA